MSGVIFGWIWGCEYCCKICKNKYNIRYLKSLPGITKICSIVSLKFHHLTTNLHKLMTSSCLQVASTIVVSIVTIDPFFFRWQGGIFILVLNLTALIVSLILSFLNILKISNKFPKWFNLAEMVYCVVLIVFLFMGGSIASFHAQGREEAIGATAVSRKCIKAILFLLKIVAARVWFSYDFKIFNPYAPPLGDVFSHFDF